MAICISSWHHSFTSTTSPFHVSPAAGNPVAVEVMTALHPEATPANASFPTIGALPSNSTTAILLQPRNAQDPMLVTLLGTVMLASPLQPQNARPLMFVTPLPTNTLVRVLQKANAEEPMLATLTSSLPLFHLLGSLTSLMSAKSEIFLKSAAAIVTFPSTS